MAVPKWTLCALVAAFECLCPSALEFDAPTLHTSGALLPAVQIHEFCAGTWIENLAIRKNGQILVTELTRPRVYLIDSQRALEPLLVHEFLGTASVLGIVEAQQDMFYVCTANYSSTTLKSSGEANVYRIDMRSFSPDQSSGAKVIKVAAIVDGAALDGLTFFAGLDGDILLISDLLQGVIWEVGIPNGDVRVTANNTYTRSAGFQINGLKTFRTELFFAVTGSKLWGKVSMSFGGIIGEDYNILSHDSFQPDDFALDIEGNGYIASLAAGNNGIVYVPRTGGDETLIASIEGPSACAFGRTIDDCHILYVTTTGGDEDYASNGSFVGRGTLSKVDLGPKAAFECRRNLYQYQSLGWTRGF